MRMSDWSSDVCSSDLQFEQIGYVRGMERLDQFLDVGGVFLVQPFDDRVDERRVEHVVIGKRRRRGGRVDGFGQVIVVAACRRSEEHTSELQSIMRNSYAVFCLKKKKNKNKT